MSDAIVVEKQDRSIVIRFNRPEMRSPLSVVVLVKLASIIADIEQLTGVDRMVFTGVNEVFASGADLREIARVTANDAAEFARRGQDLLNRISAMKVQTIAAVNGVCFGGALDLVLACDRRIASPAAVFSHPGGSLGIMTGWGGTQRLPRLIGESRALEIFLTGRRIDAVEALSMGLIDDIADDPLESALNSSAHAR